MSLNSDVRKTTVAPKTVEQLRRAPRPIHTPRWMAPVAVVLLVVVAAIIGVNLLRSDDTTTTAFEPLIVPEEQAFIDARIGQFGMGTVTPAPPVRAPSVVIHERPQGVPGMLDYYELEFIQAKTPSALAPSPAPVGFPTLIGPEEQAFVTARTGTYSPSTSTAQTRWYSERPQGVPGMLDYYELEFIQAKTPSALAPSPAPVGFPTLIGPEEQAFIDGEYFDQAVEDWCLTHTPC
jgi:hypothetical protein